MRKIPYTQIGIRRVKCFRCGRKPSKFQWQICTDNRIYRPLCEACDFALNRLVLRFMKFPDARKRMREYVREMCQ